MIFFIGGAPRVGKSILGQRLAAKFRCSWISTDLLMEVLRAKDVPGVKVEWDASPETVRTNANWFFPCLHNFVRGAHSYDQTIIIEGVDFLPQQVARLSTQFEIQAVFLGRSLMTLEQLNLFPGLSIGYSTLPEEMKRQIVQDIPTWSRFVQLEAEKFGYPFLDLANDFATGLSNAESILTSGSLPNSDGANV